MKKIVVLTAVATAVFGFALQSQAQNIVWDAAQNMVGNTDVLTNGTYFDAVTFHGTAVTVNGVVFSPLGSGLSDGTISITTPNGGAGAYGTAFTTESPSSTNYSHLTDTIGFGYYVDGTVTISGLTTGDEYQVQAWSYYAPGSADTTYTGNNTVVLSATTGQFAVGTFMASGPTETFNYNYGANGGLYDVINAVSVQELVPEPATYGMLLGGIGMLLAGQRIRRGSKNHAL